MLFVPDINLLFHHRYAITDDAYRCMRDKNLDQCVIISGESGAGKTGKLSQLLCVLVVAWFWQVLPVVICCCCCVVLAANCLRCYMFLLCGSGKLSQLLYGLLLCGSAKLFYFLYVLLVWLCFFTVFNETDLGEGVCSSFIKSIKIRKKKNKRINAISGNRFNQYF